MLSESRNSLTNSICQGSSYDARAINIIVGIVHTALRNTGNLAWLIPHMQAAAPLNTERSLYVVRDFCSINKRNIQLLSNTAWGYDIGSVSVDKGVAVDFLFSIEHSLAKLLIVVILQVLSIPATTNHRVEQYRNAAFLTGFLNETTQIGIEC